jgi:hypothetical protein
VSIGAEGNAGPAGDTVHLRLFAILLFASLATTLVHELGHYGMGTALGHAMKMSLNHAAPVSANATPASDLLLIVAAGPLVTVLQALVAFFLIRNRGLLFAYPFLFAAWFMRFAAAFVSLAHPNDEARLSIELLGGMWWLPAGVVLGLSILLWSASRRLGIGWKTNTVCYLICSVMTAAIVFGDRWLSQA